MSKQKIADLPQEEQEKLISQMKDLGIGGVYATYTVEKALAAIEKKKAQKAAAENKPETEGDGANVTPDNPDEQKDDLTTEESSDDANPPENPESSDDQDESSNPENPDNSDESLDGLSDDAKAFLNGETDELPDDAEEISEDEAKKLQQKADESKKENKKAAEPKKADGICHICRSKVFDGVCSGCGFTLRR